MRRSFARIPGSTFPSGTTGSGNVVVSTELTDLQSLEAYEWVDGPNEDDIWIIVRDAGGPNRPRHGEVTPEVGVCFWNGGLKSAGDVEFVKIANARFPGNNFTTGSDVQTWLLANGYWSTYTQGVNARILSWDLQTPGVYPGTGITIYDMDNNSDGTIAGTSPYTPGHPISGVPNYLTISGGNYIQSDTSLNAELNPPNTGTPISVFVWVYPMGNGVILSEQGSYPPDNGWYDSQIEVVAGSIKFRVWPGSAGSAIGAPITLNAWHHVGFAYDGTTLTGYLDGQSIGTQTIARDAPGANGSNLFYNLGYSTISNLGSNTGNNMRFGDLKVYNYGQYPLEIQNIYNTYKYSYGYGYLKMNLDASDPSSYSGSGSTWYDLSGNGNNGTITGASWSLGGVNGTFDFSGSNQYVSIGTPISNGAYSYTISAWVNADNVSAARNIVSSQDSPFWVNGGNLYGGAGGSYTMVSSASFPTSQWKYVTFVFNAEAGTAFLYINGVEVDSASGLVATYTQQPTFIGSHYVGTPVSFWDGKIAQVQIWEGQLSEQAILMNFNATKTRFGL